MKRTAFVIFTGALLFWGGSGYADSDKGSFWTGSRLMPKYNVREMAEKLAGAGTYSVDDKTCELSKAGSPPAEVDFDDIVPYAGFVWGNALGKDKRWGLVCGIGVVNQGSPEVELSAIGTSASDPNSQAELAHARRQLKENTEGVKYSPIIALKITYRF